MWCILLLRDSLVNKKKDVEMLVFLVDPHPFEWDVGSLLNY